MSRISRLLTDDIAILAEKALKKLGQTGVVGRKLSAICAAKKHGIKKVAEVYDISRTTLTAWIKNFRDGSLTSLIPKPKKSRGYVSNEQKLIVKGWLEETHGMTIKSLRIKIEEEFKIKLCKSAVHNLIKKLGFSYITPRPKHYKQDSSKHEEFKKKSSSTHQIKS